MGHGDKIQDKVPPRRRLNKIIHELILVDTVSQLPPATRIMVYMHYTCIVFFCNN